MNGDVPVVPGGRRLLGHALEFRRDPLALFERARAHGDVVRMDRARCGWPPTASQFSQPATSDRSRFSSWSKLASSPS